MANAMYLHGIWNVYAFQIFFVYNINLFDIHGIYIVYVLHITSMYVTYHLPLIKSPWKTSRVWKTIEEDR